MYKKALSILFMIIATNAIGQDCKFKVDETDPITNEKHIKQTFTFSKGEIALEKIGKQSRFSSRVTLGGEQNFSVPTGSTFVMKLANGDTLTGYLESESTPVTAATSAVVFTNYTLNYLVDEVFFEKLASSPLVFFRLRLSKGVQIDHEVKAGLAKKVQEYADCLKGK